MSSVTISRLDQQAPIPVADLCYVLILIYYVIVKTFRKVKKNIYHIPEELEIQLKHSQKSSEQLFYCSLLKTVAC